MDILPEIQKRVSVREFTDQPVSKEQLDRILEAGRLAPSAKNRQAWRFVVIQDPENRKKIEAASFGQEYVGQAQAIIAGCTTNVEYRMPNGQQSYPVDLSIAMSFMMLQAVHEGLGSCPVTTFRESEVKALLTVPYSMRVVMLLPIGYPASTPETRHRHPIGRIVSWEHW
jgi:nitroreductase